MGRFAVEIYDNKVPITGNNFLDLADTNYYDGVIFHRVIDGFMIQGGDPTGTGSGGPGYTIMDEFDSSLSNVQKTISMANSGPNSGGSQFFINLVDNTYLDFDKPPASSKHAVFGMVIQNFSVVQDIGKVATNASDKPLTPVVIDSIRRGNGVFIGLESEKLTPDNIGIYPSPTKGFFWIKGLTEQPATVQVIDLSGKLLLERMNNTDQMFDVTGIKPGIYIVRVNQEGAVVNKRLVIH